MDDRLIAMLQKSSTKEEVDDSFLKFGIIDMQEKVQCLDEAMYSPQVFYSSGKDTDVNYQYEIALQMFLKGSWRLYEYYEKMGLGVSCVQDK